jgi:hypothetical protein
VITRRSFGPSEVLEYMCVTFAFVGGYLLASRRRVSRMEFCGVGFISHKLWYVWNTHIVWRYRRSDIALTKKCCCLEHKQPEDWWIYRVRVSEIAWSLGKSADRYHRGQ